MFDTSIQTQAASQQVASPVTANPTAALLEGAAPLIEAGVTAGIAFHEKGKLEDELSAVDEELKGLDNEFVNYKQAAKVGGNKAALEMKARAAYKKAVGNSPVLADRASEMYYEHFGTYPSGSGGGAGGGSGGAGGSAFALTPEQSAAGEKQAYVATFRNAGKSQQVSEQMADTMLLADYAKANLAKMKYDQTVTYQSVAGNTMSAVNGLSTKFSNDMSQILKQGGRLSVDQKDQWTVNLTNQRDQLLQQVTAASTDPKTGALLVDPTSFSNLQKQVSDRFTGMINLLDSASQEDFTKRAKTLLEDTNSVEAMTRFKEYDVLNRAGMGEYITIMANAMSMGDSPYSPKKGGTIQHLFAANPAVGDLFANSQPGAAETAAVSGFRKMLTGSNPDFSPENFGYSSAMSAPINHAERAALAVTAATNPQVAKVVLKRGRPCGS